MTLKEYIEAQRIRQVEVAKEIGIDVTQLNLYINGWREIPEKYIEPICSFLKIDRKTFDRLTSDNSSDPRGGEAQ